MKNTHTYPARVLKKKLVVDHGCDQVEEGFSYSLIASLPQILDVLDLYRAFFPVCCKVLKMSFWEIPRADWLILQLPTAQVGLRN